MPSLNTVSEHKRSQRPWWKTQAYTRVRTNSLTSVAQLRVKFSPKDQTVTMEKRVKQSTPSRTSTVTMQRNIDDMLNFLAEKAVPKTAKLTPEDSDTNKQQQAEQQQQEQYQGEQMQPELTERVEGSADDRQQEQMAIGGAAASDAPEESLLLRLDMLEQQSDTLLALSGMEGVATVDNKRGRSSSPEDGIGSPDTKARKLLSSMEQMGENSRIKQMEREIQEMKDNISSMTGMFGSYMTLLTQNSELMKQQQEETAKVRSDLTALTQTHSAHTLDIGKILGDQEQQQRQIAANKNMAKEALDKATRALTNSEETKISLGKLAGEMHRLQLGAATQKQEIDKKLTDLETDSAAAKATAAALQIALDEVKAGASLPSTARSATAIVVVGVKQLRKHLDCPPQLNTTLVITELLRKAKLLHTYSSIMVMAKGGDRQQADEAVIFCHSLDHKRVAETLLKATMGGRMKTPFMRGVFIRDFFPAERMTEVKALLQYAEARKKRGDIFRYRIINRGEIPLLQVQVEKATRYETITPPGFTLANSQGQDNERMDTGEGGDGVQGGAMAVAAAVSNTVPTAMVTSMPAAQLVVAQPSAGKATGANAVPLNKRYPPAGEKDNNRSGSNSNETGGGARGVGEQTRGRGGGSRSRRNSNSSNNSSSDDGRYRLPGHRRLGDYLHPEDWPRIGEKSAQKGNRYRDQQNQKKN